MAFLDDFVQQVAAAVNAQQANPAQLPANRVQQFPVRLDSNQLFTIGQGVQGMAAQAGSAAPTSVPGMVGQALSPAEALSRNIGAPGLQPGMYGNVAAQAGTAPYSVLGGGPLAPPTPGTATAISGAGGAARAMEQATQATAQSTIGRAGAGGLGQAVTAAGGTAAAEAGLKSRIGTIFPALAGGGLAKGAMLKGGLAAVGGLMASGWLDSQDFGGENSELDQALKGGALGAGAAGGIAMLLGASAGPVGWAALAGAGLFAVGNMVFGDNTTAEDKLQTKVDTANQSIETILSNPTFGIDPETANQIRLQVASTTAFYQNAKDEAGLDTYLQGLATTVPGFLMEASARNAANQQKMQLQAAFGPVYSRMMDRSANVADQAYRTQMEAANAVSDPQVRAALQSQASQQYSAQADTQAAYAQQIAGATQQLPPSAQMVQDEASTIIQQAMGMGVG